jgi:two-component system, sensor histidine kinase and response regulator
MDCHMPGLDGFEATREIRRREGGGARIPVIAMTAAAMVEDRDRCIEAGMDAFVTKPVTLTAVGSALEQWARPSGDDTRAPAPVMSDETERPVWADEPTLDLNRITQLRQLGSMGGTDLLGQVAELFARDGKTSLGAIREATSSHSIDGLQRELHKLKGTSAQIGANRVAALCRHLEEKTGEEGALAEPDATLVSSQQLDHLESELASANRAIAQAV